MKKGFVTKLFTGLLVGALAFGMVPNVAFAEGNTEAAAEEITIGEKEYLFGTSSSTATPLTANVTLTEGYTKENSTTVTSNGVLCARVNSGDSRWYKYTTTEDGYVTFTLKRNDNSDGGEWGMAIYEQGNANYLASKSWISGSYTSKRYNYPAGTTFLIRITYDSINSTVYLPIDTVFYDITANQTAVSGWETEKNDSTSTADEVENGSFIGTAFDQYDEDYFKINISEKSILKITLGLELAELENVSNGWNVSLYKEGNANSLTEISAWNAAGTVTCTPRYNSDIPLELSPGTYYICITPSYDYSNARCYDQPYHFTIATEKAVANPVTMHRMYNPNSGEHFYTADTNERDALKAVGWNYEGVAWTAPEKSDTPVYRMYNKNSGEHHYTINESEKETLAAIGWQYEGIGWYSADEQTVPLYRLYNPNATGAQEAGAHHYTTDAAERDMLISIGWNNEGTGWYGM